MMELKSTSRETYCAPALEVVTLALGATVLLASGEKTEDEPGNF